MFNSKHRVIYGILIFALYTCGFPATQSSKEDQTLAAPGNDGPQKDFLDSVLVKKHFTFSQVNQYANIDSIYYKNHVKFAGDTVWYRNSKHPLVIIRCDERGINKKLLLVFNQHKACTATLVIGMDGDVDRYDSVVLNYKIVDDANFSTTETWTYRGGSTEDKITITRQFYWINKKGSIMAQNNIIHSFTRPKNSIARR